jgi:uncharacterized peroxidase-related enzyme
MVPNVTKVFSIWPEVFELHNEMYQKIMVNTTLLPKPIKQIMAVVAARAAACRYCQFWHTQFLALMGVDQRIIESLGDDFRQAPVDEKTMSLMEFTDRVARNPASITDEDTVKLRAHGFSDEEILEATVVIGYFGFVTCTVDALGVEIESMQSPDSDDSDTSS